jgi:hypothetical protein
MTRGRRPEGASRAERLEGSTVAKSRLQMILETLAGKRTVAQACLVLGIGDRRFHNLARLFLQAGLNSLEPRPAGRPSNQSKEVDRRIVALEKLNRDLRIELRAAQIREEIALTMPRLLKRPEKASGARKQRDRRRSQRSRSQFAAMNGTCADCKPSERPKTVTTATAEVMPGRKPHAKWRGASGLMP